MEMRRGLRPAALLLPRSGPSRRELLALAALGLTAGVPGMRAPPPAQRRGS